MSKKVKVLYFVDRLLIGGIQTFILNNIAHIDREKVQIDFLVLDDGNTYDAENDLKDKGYDVYKLKGIWIKKPQDYFKYFKAVNEFFKTNHDYKVVHLHSSSKNYYILKSAKKYGIPVRIAHSHNIGFQSKNKLQIMIGDMCKPLLKKYATDYFACSEIAGKWLFGSKKNVKIIHNAVDLKKFQFNNDIRNNIRDELRIQDKVVIGHVGRFSNQKNHTFLIDIFSELYKKNKNTILMLIGIGENEEIIRAKVRKLNLENNVLFLGFKENVNEYMWAMDYFVFPSLYEGLGLVLIEAQATGMKCFTSKNFVPREARVSDLLTYIELDNNPIIWAEEILKKDKEKEEKYEEIKAHGYDICDTAKELEEFYLK